MFLDALIARGKSLQNVKPEGYKEQKSDWLLTIDENGRFVSFQKSPRLYLRPDVARGSMILPNTGIDNYTYMFGISPPGYSQEWAQERHRAFLGTLGLLTSKPAKALLKFLQQPGRPDFHPLGKGATADDLAKLRQATPLVGKPKNPSSAKKLDASNPESLALFACVAQPVGGGPAQVSTDDPLGIVAVDVVGHPNWLLAEEIQSVHRARLLDDDEPDVSYQCSLCYKEPAKIARLFPAVSGFRLVTFNREAFEAYGAKQAYNAPTCVDCVRYLSLGFDDVLAHEGHKKFFGGPFLLWWPKDPDARKPLEIFDRVLGEDGSLADLEGFPDSYFAVLEKTMQRTAVLRFFFLPGVEVAARIRRWVEATDKMTFGQAAFRAHPEEGAQGRDLRLAFTLRLYLTLAGEQASRDLRHLSELPEKTGVEIYLEGAPLDRQKKAEELGMFDCPAYFNDAQKYAYFTGKALGRAESMRYRRGLAQRSLYETVKAATYERIHNVIDDFTKMNINGRSVTDNTLQGLLDCAREAVDRLEGKVPNRVRPSEMDAFRRGYSDYAKVAKALREAIANDKTDNDNDNEEIQP